jgi:hypothetical protein
VGAALRRSPGLDGASPGISAVRDWFSFTTEPTNEQPGADCGDRGEESGI